MADLITWFQTNWEQIPTLITAVIGVASIIVKLTPTPKDNTWLAGVVAFVSKYIALNKPVAK